MRGILCGLVISFGIGLLPFDITTTVGLVLTLVPFIIMLDGLLEKLASIEKRIWQL